MGNEADRLLDSVDCTSAFVLDRVKVDTSSAKVSWNLSVALVLEPGSLSGTIGFSIWVNFGAVWVERVWDMFALAGSVSDEVHVALVVCFSARAISSSSYSLVLVTVEAL